MNWTTIRLVFHRELRDQLRDRRTLFMVFVLPVVLYPLLGFGFLQIAMRFREQPRLLAIEGAEHLPASPSLLADDGVGFHPDLLRMVGIKAPLTWPKPGPVAGSVPADTPAAPASSPNGPLVSSKTANPTSLGPAWSDEDLRKGRVHAILVVPEDARERIARGEPVKFRIRHSGADERSTVARMTIERVLDAWAGRILADRMRRLGKAESFATPVMVEEPAVADVSSRSGRSGSFWSKIIPFMLVMMALTGAFYPAVDLCAGEKERGTIETLLVTPARRVEIVLGKFATVMLFSMAGTISNLASMGLTFRQFGATIAGDLAGKLTEFTPPSLAAVGWMLLLMIPLAGFFSALCMALAIFAKSTREGQYYLMPLFMVVSPLVFTTLSPGIELTPSLALVPVTNVALLLKAFLLNRYDHAAMYLIPVLLTTALYGYVALRFAADQFNREDVLFREAERFELIPWLKRMIRDRGRTPTFTQAWFLFLLMLILKSYFQGMLGPGLVSLLLSQILFILAPALLLARLFTIEPNRALRIRTTPWSAVALGAVLAITLHPAMTALAGELQKSISEEFARAIEAELGWIHDLPLAVRLAVLALLPAIAEELAFRGFILSGLLRSYSPRRAVLVSAVLFGVSHLLPQQMLPTTLLGIVMGWLAIRTNSVLPGMVFHATHNALAVLRADGLMRARAAAEQAGGTEAAQAPDLGYDAPLVVMSLLGSLLIIGLLSGSWRNRLTGFGSGRQPENAPRSAPA
jgi:sodium transport system permease protein